MAAERIVVVSADGHVGPPPEAYRPYLETRYHADLDELVVENESWLEGTISQARFGPETLDVIDRDDAVRSGGEQGAWDFERRLVELDREGIAAELLIPGHQLATLPFFSTVNKPHPPELRAAGRRAYHRWAADAMAGADGRLFGIADAGPCLDMDETLSELRWAADHGYRGVNPPGTIADPALPPPTDPGFEPFWAACAELGLVLTAHAGYGMPQFGLEAARMRAELAKAMGGQEKVLQMGIGREDKDRQRIDEMPPDSPTRLALSLGRRLVWQLMLAGVFDRHPSLQIVLTECRADWVPATLAHLDQAHADGRFPSVRRPSEYWQQHCAVAPSSPRPYEVAMRHEIGVDRFLFGSDYPHPEGTWPNTLEWLRTAFAGVPEDELRRMLGGNAIDIYGLDGAHLAAVAERVGPTVSSITDGAAVDPRLLDNFASRAGFARPQEQPDPAFVDRWLDQDVMAVGAS